MNSATKEQWLIALRSGSYSQMRGAFKARTLNINEDKSRYLMGWSYCAAGLLAEIISFPMQQMRTTDGGERWTFNVDELISAVKADKEYFNIVMILNDIKGHRFEQIADYIEKNL